MTETIEFKEDNLLKANIKYAIIGIAIGILLSLLTSVQYHQIILLKYAAINILISCLITLSITNSVYVYERFLKRTSTSYWAYVIGFYCCNLVGMFIGTELSRVSIYIIYKIPYNHQDNLIDYRFNLFLVLVVGTLLLLFKAQKVNLQSLVKSKEMDVIKMSQLKTQAELETLQSKINPHFLYNSLNSIACLVHEDPDKAEEMVIKLSTLFRYSINSNQDSYSTIKEEIEILLTYLDIEKIRFGERIVILTDVDSETLDLLIPRFLIQPLAENAIKHGLKNKAKDGILSIEIKKIENSILILIHDNGIPFPEELYNGYGLQSTYDKLKLLYPDGYEINFCNTPSKFVKLVLPIKK